MTTHIAFQPRYAGHGAPVNFNLSASTGDEARDRGLALQHAAQSGMHLQKLDLGTVNAHGLNLSGLRLTECTGHLTATGADLSDVQVSICALVMKANADTNMERIGLSSCDLDGSILAGAYMAEATVDRCSLRNADLTGIVAPDSVWSGTKTGGAKLTGWLCPFADLSRFAGHETIVETSEGTEDDRALLRRCQWEGVASVRRQVQVAEQLTAEAAGTVHVHRPWLALDRRESSE